jgi:hypothetical protein
VGSHAFVVSAIDGSELDKALVAVGGRGFEGGLEVRGIMGASG